MGVIVTPQEVVNFLRITTREGSRAPTIVQVSETSDPSMATLDMIIEGVEAEFDEETFHSWGHLSNTTETHDIHATYERGRGIPIHLAHRSVATLDSTKGDRLALWNGRDWDEILSGGIQRYSQIEGMGKVYIRALVFALFREDRVRVTYRYGTMNVPKGIKFALVKKCAVKLLESSLAQNTIQFGNDRGVTMADTLSSWNEEYDKAVFRHMDWTRIEY